MVECAVCCAVVCGRCAAGVEAPSADEGLLCVVMLPMHWVAVLMQHMLRCGQSAPGVDYWHLCWWEAVPHQALAGTLTRSVVSWALRDVAVLLLCTAAGACLVGDCLLQPDACQCRAHLLHRGSPSFGNRA